MPEDDQRKEKNVIRNLGAEIMVGLLQSRLASVFCKRKNRKKIKICIVLS